MQLRKWVIWSVLSLVISFNLSAQVENQEEEENMPAFVDMEVGEEEEIPITWPKTNDTIRWKLGHKYGFVCNKTEVLIPFEYYDLPQNFAPLMVAKKEGKTGVINDRNETIIPFEYDGINYYENGFMVFKFEKRSRKYGMLDLEGNLILPLIYDSTGPAYKGYFFNGQEAVFLARTYDPVKSYYFNQTGELIFETPYRQHTNIGDRYFRVINKDYKHGLLNQENEIILECQYNRISWAQKGKACVNLAKNTYVINLVDKSVFHEDFTQYGKPDEHNNMIVSKYIEKKKHEAILNLDGKIIHPLENVNITHLEGTDMYALRVKNKLVNVIDANGKAVPEIHPMPANIWGLSKGFYATKNLNNEWQVFTKERELFISALFAELRRIDPRTHKYPPHIDKEKAIAIVSIAPEYVKYYLYENGIMEKR